MIASVEQYGGFYIGRYEASQGQNNFPASKRVSDSEPGRIWVQFSPQDTVIACENLYADNDTVQGFFPWGINWDTTLQWLIDSGCKTWEEVARDSPAWGNYSNDAFSNGARGNLTGVWEEAKSNNIYDLAGNNWDPGALRQQLRDARRRLQPDGRSLPGQRLSSSPAGPATWEQPSSQRMLPDRVVCEISGENQNEERDHHRSQFRSGL